jgi:hypothetical protein
MSKIRTGQITESSEAFTSWTPTWGGITIGNATVTAKYLQVGKSFRFYITIAAGTTTALPSAADVVFTIPSALSLAGVTKFNSIGTGTYYDTSAAKLYLLDVVTNSNSTTTLLIQVRLVSSSNIIGGALDTANVAAIGTGDAITVNGQAEVS